jgi:hypothetical protein
MNENEPHLIKIKGDNGEDYVSANIGPSVHDVFIPDPKDLQPVPFVLGDGSTYTGGVNSPLVVTNPEGARYKLRRKERYPRTVKVVSRIKRGPGKGRVRRFTKQYWREYWAYYGIRN